MKNLFHLSVSELQLMNLPAEISIVVHPFYDVRARHLLDVGRRSTVITTPNGIEEYRRCYSSMTRVSSLSVYQRQLANLLSEQKPVLFFEEWDVVADTEKRIPAWHVQNSLLINTHPGNADPYEAPSVELTEEVISLATSMKKDVTAVADWAIALSEAICNLGSKKFVVYGGNFFDVPTFGCAGQVLAFLFGMKDLGKIDAVRVGTKAVLRP